MVSELEDLRLGDTPTHSALFIPVEEADSIIGRWRQEHDPLAKAGVPAHITLIVPWLEPELITSDRLSDLDETLHDVKAFEFDLTHVDWFGRRVLWAAPVPTQPFLDLTQRLAARYGTPPWGGQFDEVIPHLTIAHADATPGWCRSRPTSRSGCPYGATRTRSG